MADFDQQEEAAPAAEDAPAPAPSEASEESPTGGGGRGGRGGRGRGVGRGRSGRGRIVDKRSSNAFMEDATQQYGQSDEEEEAQRRRMRAAASALESRFGRRSDARLVDASLEMRVPFVRRRVPLGARGRTSV